MAKCATKLSPVEFKRRDFGGGERPILANGGIGFAVTHERAGCSGGAAGRLGNNVIGAIVAQGTGEETENSRAQDEAKGLEGLKINAEQFLPDGNESDQSGYFFKTLP